MFARGAVYLHAACPEQGRRVYPESVQRAHLPAPKNLTPKSNYSGHPTKDVHPEPAEGLFSPSELSTNGCRPSASSSTPFLSPISNSRASSFQVLALSFISRSFTNPRASNGFRTLTSKVRGTPPAWSDQSASLPAKGCRLSVGGLPSKSFRCHSYAKTGGYRVLVIPVLLSVSCRPSALHGLRSSPRRTQAGVPAPPVTSHQSLVTLLPLPLSLSSHSTPRLLRLPLLQRNLPISRQFAGARPAGMPRFAYRCPNAHH